MILFQLLISFSLTFIVVASYIITISFTLWMMIDAGKQDRFWWLTVIIGVPIIGPAAYYFTEKKHEYRKVESRHIHESETEEQHENAPKKKRVRKVKSEGIPESTMENKVEDTLTEKRLLATSEEVK